MKPSHLTRLTAATKDWVPGFVSSEAAFTFTALRLWSAPLSAGSSCLADKRPWHRTPSTEMGPRYRPSQLQAGHVSYQQKKILLNIYEHNTENRKTTKQTNTDEKKHHKDSMLIGFFLDMCLALNGWKRLPSTFWSPSYNSQKLSFQPSGSPREESSSPQKEQVCNALDFCSKEQHIYI